MFLPLKPLLWRQLKNKFLSRRSSSRRTIITRITPAAKVDGAHPIQLCINPF
jgi:hypothetical protein